MAGETDRLIRLAHSAAPEPTEREYDVLIASGEQVTVALLSIVLNRMGCKAKSYLAYQVKIITDGDFTRARILKVDRSPIEEDLRQGYVVVVAGFQGIDRKNNVTTLGRGGSDTSAVALAAALGADVCEICTDVDGVYTADPNICDNARLLKKYPTRRCSSSQAPGRRYCTPGRWSWRKIRGPRLCAVLVQRRSRDFGYEGG